MSTPASIEIIIHEVSEMRRSDRRIGIVGAASSLAVNWCGRFDRNRSAAATKRRVSVTVQDVESEPDEQPPSETHPGEVRQTAHDEHTEQRADYPHDVHEFDAERARTIRICVPQHYHPDAHQRERKERPDVGQIVGLASVAN